MTGPYGIPYEELVMQQKEAEESLPYTMRDVRKALVKLPPKDRHGIIFVLDSGQAEIERLTAEVDKWREWTLESRNEINPVLARMRQLESGLMKIRKRAGSINHTDDVIYDMATNALRKTK
ncbi:MAG: hypothetical protein IT205_03095 [Fimbriimonadaceae bacterium]|nr:hypothetical protein [Fimbriimonadaceae bacterium]